MKRLNFRGSQIEIDDPANVRFDNDFDRGFYAFCYQQITDGHTYSPIINSDLFYDQPKYNFDLSQKYLESFPALPRPSAKATNKDRLTLKLIIREFYERFPVFVGLVKNNVLLASQSIKNAELLFDDTVKLENFIEIKGVIDEVNRSAWDRDKDSSESQSGVSTLGTISETLLKKVFDNVVDNTNFFPVNQSEVQSYGDFVLMCLPNNLWLSVKSNFARERLLASGYTNDILGVGFFQDSSEFTSSVRIRNFQRAGFLAMYCPDVPVSEEQLNNHTNTHDEIIDYYQNEGTVLPTNINGKPFIRRLSDLHTDLTAILNEQDVRKRFVVDF